MGVRTVRRHLASLEADGFIRRAKRYREDGTRSSDLIFLTVTLPADLAASDGGLPANHDRTTGQTVQGLPATGGRAEVPDELPEGSTRYIADSFDGFYSVYPLKVEPKKARKAWDKIDPVEFPAVLAGATRYRDDPNRDPGFTKHPATWLNAGCWEDDPLPSRTNSNDKRTHQPIEEWWDRSEPSGELDL